MNRNSKLMIFACWLIQLVISVPITPKQYEHSKIMHQINFAAHAGHWSTVESILHTSLDSSLLTYSIRRAELHNKHQDILVLRDLVGAEKYDELAKRTMDESEVELLDKLAKSATNIEWKSDNDDANTLDSMLIFAVDQGDLRATKVLLYRGADVHYQSDIALQSASRNAHYEITGLLLECGADPRAGDSNALRGALLIGDEKMVELLLEFNADPRGNHAELLKRAASKGDANSVESILSSDGVKFTAKEICAAIEMAALGGHSAIVQMLLREGANIFAKKNASLNPVASPRYAGPMTFSCRSLKADYAGVLDEELPLKMAKTGEDGSAVSPRYAGRSLEADYAGVLDEELSLKMAKTGKDGSALVVFSGPSSEGNKAGNKRKFGGPNNEILRNPRAFQSSEGGSGEDADSPRYYSAEEELENPGVDSKTNYLALPKIDHGSLVEGYGPTFYGSPSSFSSKRRSGDRSHAAGLNNLGNTCFMNSALQCLFHVKPLVEYLSKDGDYMQDINSNGPNNGRLANAFALLAHDVWRNGRPLSPLELKRQCEHLAPYLFEDQSQQDAQEFLLSLISGLHEELKRVGNQQTAAAAAAGHNNDDSGESLPNNQRAEFLWNKCRALEDSKILDLFGGQLQSTIECLTCGYKSLSFEQFWDLALPLPDGNVHDDEYDYCGLYGCDYGDIDGGLSDDGLNTSDDEAKADESYERYYRGIRSSRHRERFGRQPYSTRVNIQDCLSSFATPEILDGDEKYRCPRCSEKRRASKCLHVCRFPEILILQIKRFVHNGWTRRKLNKKVEYPEILEDLSVLQCGEPRNQDGNGATGSDSEAAKQRYQLIGVCSHRGQLNLGHYTARGKSLVNGEWYLYDDNRCSPSTPTDPDAYILFYKRVPVE